MQSSARYENIQLNVGTLFNCQKKKEHLLIHTEQRPIGVTDVNEVPQAQIYSVSRGYPEEYSVE